MSQLSEIIADNVARVRERMAAAAQRSGRTADDVTLVAVTKYVGATETRAVIAAGCHDLAESRPQELWRKAELLDGEPIRWHMVGHLQRNKARRTVPLISLLHSGDSDRLITAISAEADRVGQRLPVLLEVNISGDSAKHGLAPDATEPALQHLAELPGIQIRGLMGMAALGSTPETARHDFAALRQLRDRLQHEAPPGVSLDDLSMGMSRDFEAAIEEGATLVRVGSSLFEGIAR